MSLGLPKIFTSSKPLILVIQVTIQHLHEDDGSNREHRSNFLKSLEAATSTDASVSSNGSSRSAFGSPRHTSGGIDTTLTTTSTAVSVYNTAASSLSSRAEPLGRNWYEQVKRVPGNKVCADCGNSDAKWASINLGVCLHCFSTILIFRQLQVVICIECSGAHRSLGVHVSKVRSLTMDDLSDEQKCVMLELGALILKASCYEADDL